MRNEELECVMQHKPILVALPQYVFGLLLYSLPTIVGSLFNEYNAAESDHYIRICRVIAVAKHDPAGA